MNTTVTGLDQFLFVVLPYMVMFIFFVDTIMRYRKAQYTYSSLSSQFLENQQHFWSLVPFHYGIITVLTGHVVAFLIPLQVLAWNSKPPAGGRAGVCEPPLAPRCAAVPTSAPTCAAGAPNHASAARAGDSDPSLRAATAAPANPMH